MTSPEPPRPRTAAPGDDPWHRLDADLEPCGQAMILHVRGHVDAHTRSRWDGLLNSALTATVAGGSGHLLVDLSGSGFLSLRAILDLTRVRRRCPVEIAVIDDREHSVIHRVVAAAGLSAWLPVYPDLVTALADRSRAVGSPEPGLARARGRPASFAPTPSA
ncbi:anti-sigma factor antagonist [Nocardia thailandica]